MPTRIKETLKKREFEYTSPDGDMCTITYMESGGRKYVELSRQRVQSKEEESKYDTFTLDADVFFDITDMLREITQPAMPRHSLQEPIVMDHRGGTQADIIESQVNDSMQRLDDSVKPVMSLSPNQTEEDKLRTGVDLGRQTKVGATPPEFKIGDPEDPNIPKWQKEVLDRSELERPKGHKSTGSQGLDFQRVQPKDLI